MCPRLTLPAQDPARVRLHEEMTRLTKRINVANLELDNLGKASRAQAKKLNKLRKDLAALQEERVSQGQGRAGCLVAVVVMGTPSGTFKCAPKIVLCQAATQYGICSTASAWWDPSVCCALPLCPRPSPPPPLDAALHARRTRWTLARVVTACSWMRRSCLSTGS